MIHRTAGHHLAFGSGIHARLGGPLARMEDDTPRYRSDIFRSLAELPITFTGAREAA